MNDRISLAESDKATWRRIRSAFPHRKHRSDYPAVKIGRLGVNVGAQHKHIGTDILDFVKQTFIAKNRTGCCFVTVDVLQSAVPFYEGFAGARSFFVFARALAEGWLSGVADLSAWFIAGLARIVELGVGKRGLSARR